METLGSIKKTVVDHRGRTPDSLMINAQSLTHVSMGEDKSVDSNVAVGEQMAILCSNISSCVEPLDQVAEVGNSESDEDLLTFDEQRLKDPEDSSLPKSPSFDLPTNSRVHSQVVVKKPKEILLPSSLPNGYLDDRVTGSSHWENGFQCSHSIPDEGKRDNVSLDIGESSIISNILSLDSDSWDESLSSSQNIANLLGETDNKQQVPLRESTSWMGQNNNNNQSRFSFAREDCVNEVTNIEPSLSSIGQAFMNRPFSHDFVDTGECYVGKYDNSNGFSSFGFEGPDSFATGYSNISANIVSLL